MTRQWLQKHLNFVKKADSIEEVALRVDAILVRLSLTGLEDFSVGIPDESAEL